MAFQLTKEFVEKIKILVQEKESEELHLIFNEVLAPDIADLLQALEFEQSKYLLSQFNEEKSAEILIELDEDIRERFIDPLSSKEIVNELINNLESDDAADVIQELSNKKQKEVLSNITNPKQASDIADLLSYEENSAGALMAKELIKVSERWSILRCVYRNEKTSKKCK